MSSNKLKNLHNRKNILWFLELDKNQELLTKNERRNFVLFSIKRSWRELFVLKRYNAFRLELLIIFITVCMTASDLLWSFLSVFK